MEKKTLWHSLSVEDVMQNLDTHTNGLSMVEVVKRISLYGMNTLIKEKRLTNAQLLLRQLSHPLVLILIGAVALSFFQQDWIETIVISIAVLLNALIGFFQEYKAESALEALQSLLQPHARVIREGKEMDILASELVAGDVLMLRLGDQITADARLIEVHDLEVNEAALTGESLPIRKSIDVQPKGTILAERSNMVFAGTSVVAGRTVAIVTEIGMRTELGRITQLVFKTPEEKTPLEQQLFELARFLAGTVIGLVALLFLIGIAGGRSALEMFEMAIALAVAAVPEGLGVSVTVILAIGMQRMLHRQSLARRLVAVETLGCVSVICVDKTGTLTTGQMQVTKVIADDREKLIKIASVSSDATVVRSDGMIEEIRGSSTERALMQYALDQKHDPIALRDHYPRIAELPFDSVHKYMATAHVFQKRPLQNGVFSSHGASAAASTHLLSASRRSASPFNENPSIFQRSLHDESVWFLKGAPERILERLKDQTREKWEKAFVSLTAQGLRVIAFAYRTAPQDQKLTHEALHDFECVGLMGLRDPLRDETREQIRAATQAGIKTVMITGDHPKTAFAIAKEAKMAVEADQVVEGRELDAWSDEELARRASRFSVFARVEPRHKLRIVDALQARGEVVAMTGDGVNDAPALKAADIGIALGSGTEVAKQASDIVLLDNNLGTITAAIREGRVMFDNIRKTTVYLLADSFTEIVLISGSILLGLPLPLLPIQILWINLVADTLPSIGLTFESAEKDVMQLHPRPRSEPVLNREMLFIVYLIGLVTDVILFALFIWLLHQSLDLGVIRSLLFAAVGIDSLLYVFAVKHLRQSLFSANPFSNPWLLGAVAVGFALIFLPFVFPLFQTFLGLSPLGLSDWLFLFMMGVIKLGAIEGAKAFFFSRKTRDITL